MLKRLDAEYVQGGRPTNNWYKAKKSATFDCVVMGFSLGKGKYNTQIGAVRFGQYHNGNLVELGQASGMTDADRDINVKVSRTIYRQGRYDQRYGTAEVRSNPASSIWWNEIR